MRVEHEHLLFNTINHLLEKQNENHSKIETQNEKIDCIEKENLELQNKIEMQNSTIENQNKKLKELHHLKNNESKIDSKNEILENKLKDFKKQIENLNQFAEDMSKLHLTLSHPIIHLRRPIVDRKEYEEAKEVEQWNDFTEDISKRNDVPDFVVNLKKAVALYSRTIYPREHWNRFLIASQMIPKNFIFNNLLKLECPFLVYCLSVKVFDEYSEFEDEYKSEPYIKNTESVASYCDVDNFMFNVILYHELIIKNLTLYHSTDEKKHLKISCDGTRVDVSKSVHDNCGYNKFGCFIFHLRE